MRLKAIIKELLVMSKTERNGVTALLIILAVLIIVRFTLPVFLQNNDRASDDLENKITMLKMQRDSMMGIESAASTKNASLPFRLKNKSNQELNINQPAAHSPETRSELHFFDFDPNTTTYDTLLLIGFSKKIAHTILNYREKGGRFYKPSDLNRIYGMDSVFVMQLLPFIKIEKNVRNKEIKKDAEFIVEINSADSALFTKLPGIGPIFASRICKFRSYLGGYVSVQQIREVYGLSEETFSQIVPLLVVDTSLIQHISLNFSDVNDFKKHPYCNYSLARRIVDHRSKQGRFKSVEELVNDSVIANVDFEKLAPYLSVNE